jgi:uncharacterized repeat protein (TIGR02543 family)
MLIFDNGGQAGYGAYIKGLIKADGNPLGTYPNTLRMFSRVLEINPVTKQVVWEFKQPRLSEDLDGDGKILGNEKLFFSNLMSSAQRLPNGNTLVTEADPGRVFEVTPSGNVVWEYAPTWLKPGGPFVGAIYRAYRIPYSWAPLQAPGTSELTTSSTSGGSVTTPGEGLFTYESDESAQVEATPEENWSFLKWTGTAVDAGMVADSGKANTTVTMQENYDLKAHFISKWYTLTVSSTSGGSVTDPGEGEISVSYNFMIPLVATPDEHYHFVKWTGSAVATNKVGASANTGVLVDEDCDVKAHFAIDTHTLTTSSTTGGSVTTPGEETKEYDYGTTVDLVATPEQGYCFVGWNGPVADPSSKSTTVTITEDISVRAVFQAKKKPANPS